MQINAGVISHVSAARQFNVSVLHNSQVTTAIKPMRAVYGGIYCENFGSSG
jgi:hypothetical protein